MYSTYPILGHKLWAKTLIKHGPLFRHREVLRHDFDALWWVHPSEV